MLQRVKDYIDRFSLLEPSCRVLVAVSGGADSVALLDMLCRLGYDCVVAHCNFHLRGEESDRDQQFVEFLASKYSLPIFVKHFDTTAYSQSERISIEMAARDLRYRWFEELRQSEHCAAIAVAHHKNDQAETILLNLRRGTGIRGLVGMRPKNGYIIRPLLCLSKEDIMLYINLRGLSFVTDSTNTDTRFQRNELREQLSHYPASAIAHFADAAERMMGYEKIVNEYVRKVKTTIRIENAAETKIDIPQLLQTVAPEIVLYELLQPYGFSQTDAIFRSLSSPSGRRFYSEHFVLIKDRQYLFIYPINTEIENKNFSVSISSARPDAFPTADAQSCYLDADKLKQPLALRHWQDGDYFQPIGMSGRKKLQDFFTDHHLNLQQKHQVWLLTSAEDIVWVVGYRIDDRYKITPQTTNFAHICISSAS